jgi:hypothetical protein
MAELLAAAKEVERLTDELERARADLRAAVKTAHDAGETVSEIARRMGVTRTRVYQLLRP